MKDVGALINQECSLCARIVDAGDRLESLRKLARRTPAKTLLAERRWREARESLAELDEGFVEWETAPRGHLVKEAKASQKEWEKRMEKYK